MEHLLQLNIDKNQDDCIDWVLMGSDDKFQTPKVYTVGSQLRIN